MPKRPSCSLPQEYPDQSRNVRKCTSSPFTEPERQKITSAAKSGSPAAAQWRPLPRIQVPLSSTLQPQPSVELKVEPVALTPVIPLPTRGPVLNTRQAPHPNGRAGPQYHADLDRWERSILEEHSATMENSENAMKELENLESAQRRGLLKLDGMQYGAKFQKLVKYIYDEQSKVENYQQQLRVIANR
jgi:hypothetical protein